MTVNQWYHKSKRHFQWHVRIRSCGTVWKTHQHQSIINIYLDMVQNTARLSGKLDPQKYNSDETIHFNKLQTCSTFTFIKSGILLHINHTSVQMNSFHLSTVMPLWKQWMQDKSSVNTASIRVNWFWHNTHMSSLNMHNISFYIQ